MTSPTPQLTLYRQWLHDSRGLQFTSYKELWEWSVQDTDAFWQSIWDYHAIESPTPHLAVLGNRTMPGAEWFAGAQVNFVREVFRHVAAGRDAGLPAIVGGSETGEFADISWPELKRQVSALALYLKGMGIIRGDRVVAYLPNIPETIIAFLACASVGAVWSACAPDMGTPAVLDRFRQIEPSLLIAVDGVHYGGKAQDRARVVNEIAAALGTALKVICIRTAFADETVANAVPWSNAIAGNSQEIANFVPEWLPFDHPLWIVYSSGTTGLPKPIVHGHGGIMLNMCVGSMHNDIGASYASNTYGDRYFWFSSPNWVLWNAQPAVLARGTTIVLYDGNPSSTRANPDWSVLWKFAALKKATFFGAGATFFTSCMKTGVILGECGDLSLVRTLASTGSPLSGDVQEWGSEQMRRAGVPDVWWCNITGGTDFCGAFVSGYRELPETPGRLQCRQLGASVEAWNEQGQSLIGAVGELVCTKPIPSMPLYLWGDHDGSKYLASYFDMFPGVWRHGDWIEVCDDGSCIAYGRSDATINRHGLRMGTSELYKPIEAIAEVVDSMIVDLEYLGRPSYMPLFVVLRNGLTLNDELRSKIASAIKTSLSPRFIPDEIIQVQEIPRTLSGKKQEIPIKKLMLGHSSETVINRETMANPWCLDWYAEFAAAFTRRESHAAAERSGSISS